MKFTAAGDAFGVAHGVRAGARPWDQDTAVQTT
jgi:hypothetical protein